MDDSDDKVRRNLVVASAAVFFCWVAGIPLVAVAERVLGLNAADARLHLDSTRFLGAVLIVLVYLSLRFRFAGDTQTAYAEMKTEWESLTRRLVYRAVAKQALRFVVTGRESSMFGGTLSVAVDAMTASMEESYEKSGGTSIPIGRPTELTVRIVQHDINSDLVKEVYEGKLQVAAAWTSPNRMTTSGGIGASFCMTRAQKASVRVKALVILASYSRSSLKMFLPSTLGAIAILIVVAQLVASAGHSEASEQAHPALTKRLLDRGDTAPRAPAGIKAIAKAASIA